MNVSFLRRLGPDPHEGGRQSAGASGCPDFFELEGGDFAFIGKDISAAAGSLPPSAGCGFDEKIVQVPRRLILEARDAIAALS
jgi:hypothetical protein